MKTEKSSIIVSIEVLLKISFFFGIFLPACCCTSTPTCQEAPRTEYVLQSDLLGLQVSMKPYSYQLIEKSSGQILVSHNSSIVKLNSITCQQKLQYTK